MADNWLAQEVGNESKKLSNQSRKIKFSLSLISLLMCVGLGVALANSKPASKARGTLLGVSTSASPTPTSTPVSVSESALKAGQDQAAYQQALANGDKALAASLLQQAKIEQQNLTQQEQQFNVANNTIPVSIPSTASAYTLPPTPTPAVCAYPGMVGASSQKLTQAENQYSNDQQASQTSAMPNGEQYFGISASQHEAAWASALQTDQNNISSAQNTLSYYKSQPGC